MRFEFRWLSICLLAVIAACSPFGTGANLEIVIEPDDFVVLPCKRVTEQLPCALVVAGGKRVLLGAPAGAAASFGADHLAQLDAVLLFSLRATDIEGLDDVRNRSWRVGRDRPLSAIGPVGIEDFVTALNKAYEQADALRVVEDGIPPGGYDAAILSAVTAVSGQIVFDTGDLWIERRAEGYLVFYKQSVTLALTKCGSASAEEAGFLISCAEDSPDLVWPVSEPVFLQK